MRMFRRQTGSDIPNLNTAALPDLIFTVLFFFMFVTHMRQTDSSVPVTPPQGSNLEKVAMRPSVITMFVTGGQTVNIDNRNVKVDDVADYISAERKKMAPEDAGRIMVNIKADKSVRMGTINSLRQQLRSINVLNVNYSATEKKNGNLKRQQTNNNLEK